MSDNLLTRRGNSKKFLSILLLSFILCLITVLIVAYGLANLTRQQLAETQEFKYTPPASTSKDQIRRILLRRQGENGLEFLEILADGTINLYDANMKLIKSGLQGFGRITNLFKNFEQKLASGTGFECPPGFELTIFTNRGIYACKSGAGVGSGPPPADLINEIIDIVKDTLNPTPTLRPTHTPPPGITTAVPTPTSFIYLSPTALPNWNPLTPTPLPEYMTAPPFNCKDYHFGRPFTISNVICGLDQ